jgi:hypothetical protein
VFRPFPDFLLWRKFYVKNASVEVARVTFVLFLSPHGASTYLYDVSQCLVFGGPFLGRVVA